MSKTRLTDEEVDRRLVGRDIKRIGKYTFTRVHIEWECLIDGHRWFAKPNSIFNGHGCPKCLKSYKLTNSDIDEKIKDKNIKRIDDYKGTLTPIEWECLIDGHRWITTPNNITKTKSHGCRICAKRKLSEIRRHNISIIETFCDGADLKYLGNYKNNRTKFDVECKRCGKKYKTTLNSLYRGCGCSCVRLKKEHEIYMLLKKINFDIFEKQKRLQFNNKNYYIDFYLVVNNKKIFIEYNGKQHYEPIDYFGGEETFKKQQKRDEEIKKYCKDKNIILIEIPYWMNIKEKKEIIKNLINI